MILFFYKYCVKQIKFIVYYKQKNQKYMLFSERQNDSMCFVECRLYLPKHDRLEESHVSNGKGQGYGIKTFRKNNQKS